MLICLAKRQKNKRQQQQELNVLLGLELPDEHLVASFQSAASLADVASLDDISSMTSLDDIDSVASLDQAYF